MNINKNRLDRRQKRVRGKIHGTTSMPRLSVHRTNKYFYAQIIDDQQGKTILGISEKQVEDPVRAEGLADSVLAEHGRAEGQASSKVETAKKLGVLFAKQALEKNIKTVIFDRGRYVYHGRVKAFADGAREGGLQF